jgi:hypothetical protein
MAQPAMSEPTFRTALRSELVATAIMLAAVRTMFENSHYFIQFLEVRLVYGRLCTCHFFVRGVDITRPHQLAHLQTPHAVCIGSYL